MARTSAARRRWRRSWRGARWRASTWKTAASGSRRRGVVAEALASPRCALRRLNLSSQLHRRDRGETRRGGRGSGRRGAFGTAHRRTRARAPRASRESQRVGCEGATALADAAETSDAFARLEILDATTNGIGPRGWRRWRARRSEGRARRRFASCDWRGIPSAAGARALVRARARHLRIRTGIDPTLETLTLGSARLGVVGAAAVAWAMSRPRGRLPASRGDLSANDIGEQVGAAPRFASRGAKSSASRRRERAGRAGGTRTPPPAGTRRSTALSSLADDLASARSLRRLDLGYNSLGDAGVPPSPPRWRERRRRRRATRTRTNEAAGASSSERGGGASSSERGGGVELDLQRNSIGNAGALALAEALPGVADAPGSTRGARRLEE